MRNQRPRRQVQDALAATAQEGEPDKERDEATDGAHEKERKPKGDARGNHDESRAPAVDLAANEEEHSRAGQCAHRIRDGEERPGEPQLGEHGIDKGGDAVCLRRTRQKGG